jgi:hypothetical protein
MAVHGENEETIYEFTGWLRNAAEMVALDPLTRAPIRDRNDIFVLQTALVGEADVVSVAFFIGIARIRATVNRWCPRAAAALRLCD